MSRVQTCRVSCPDIQDVVSVDKCHGTRYPFFSFLFFVVVIGSLYGLYFLYCVRQRDLIYSSPLFTPTLGVVPTSSPSFVRLFRVPTLQDLVFGSWIPSYFQSGPGVLYLLKEPSQLNCLQDVSVANTSGPVERPRQARTSYPTEFRSTDELSYLSLHRSGSTVQIVRVNTTSPMLRVSYVSFHRGTPPYVRFPVKDLEQVFYSNQYGRSLRHHVQLLY